MKTISKIFLATLLFGFISLAQADDYRKHGRDHHERDHHEYEHHNWYKNESISKAEYLKRHEEIFDRMDLNKDKILTRDERKSFWETQERHYKDRSHTDGKKSFWDSDDKYKR